MAITTRDSQWTAHTAPAWLDDPYVLMAKCAWHLGKADDAIRFLKQGLELNPASPAGKEFALT
ncbi:tetratricopeptide repeat protein, partial [Streptomyces caeruleatus]